jgi:hypothetical protein
VWPAPEASAGATEQKGRRSSAPQYSITPTLPGGGAGVEEKEADVPALRYSMPPGRSGGVRGQEV